MTMILLLAVNGTFAILETGCKKIEQGFQFDKDSNLKTFTFICTIMSLLLPMMHKELNSHKQKSTCWQKSQQIYSHQNGRFHFIIGEDLKQLRQRPFFLSKSMYGYAPCFYVFSAASVICTLSDQ